jgi:hypothetical protein
MRELEVRWATLQGDGPFTKTKMVIKFRNWSQFKGAWTNGKSHNEKFMVGSGDINLTNTSTGLLDHWKANCMK